MKYLRSVVVLTIALGRAWAHAQTMETDDFSALSETGLLQRYGQQDMPESSMAALAAELAVHQAQNQRGGVSIITVGPDMDCQFSSVQAAINASVDGDTIRVMTGVYNESIFIFSKDLRVIGGFPDCVSQTPSGRSTLDQQGTGLGVDVFYPAALGDPLREVVLENWLVRNGGGSGDFVGGVVVEGRPGRLAVELNNVEIRDNIKTGSSDNGAGLRIQVSGDGADTGGVPFGPLVEIDNDSANRQ